jgi:hypothetical protein
MNSLIILFTSALVGTLPFTSAAQTAPALAASKLYVGLGASYTRYNSPSQVGPTLTVGLQLTPRLAVQTGTSLYWRKNTSFFGSYYDLSTNEQVTDVSFTDYDRLLAVPVLARYTVTPLTSRFQLDILGGATALYYFGHYTQTSTTQSQGTQTEERDSYNRFTGVLSLGPSLRYAFTPQVELMGDFLLNTSWEGNIYHRTYPVSLTISARYRFPR